MMLDQGEEVLKSTGVKDLSKEQLLALLQETSFAAKETSVFQGVLAWGQANNGRGTVAQAVCDFIPHINFHDMDHVFLQQTVRPSNVVPESVVLDAMMAMMDDLKCSVRPGAKRALQTGDDDRPQRRIRRRQSCLPEWDASSPLIADMGWYELSGPPS